MPRGVYPRKPKTEQGTITPKAPKNGTAPKKVGRPPKAVAGPTVSVHDRFTVLLENIQTLAGIVVEFSKANSQQDIVRKAATELNAQISCLTTLRQSIFGNPQAPEEKPQTTALPTMTVPVGHPAVQ